MRGGIELPRARHDREARDLDHGKACAGDFPVAGAARKPQDAPVIGDVQVAVRILSDARRGEAGNAPVPDPVEDASTSRSGLPGCTSPKTRGLALSGSASCSLSTKSRRDSGREVDEDTLGNLPGLFAASESSRV